MPNDAVPNPGSQEARDAGCICPVLDNGHGAGWMGGVRDSDTGEIVFVVVEGCPLHGAELEANRAE